MSGPTVLRWEDGGGPDLVEQLCSRPGRWAVVAEDLSNTQTWSLTATVEHLGYGIETRCAPMDDGPHGVRYEVLARYVPPAAVGSSDKTDRED
jgi:hypothetical protein